MTERDEVALRFLVDQKVCWEPDLAVLVGPLAGHRRLADKGVRSLVDRWVRAGWVTASRIWVGRPRLVTVTVLGAGLAAGDTSYRVPADAHRLHLAAISRTRLWLMGTTVTGWGRLVEWVPERAWRAANFDGGAGAGHPPDGVARFEHGPGEVAVEIELTPKTSQTLDEHVSATVHGFDAAWYFCGSPVLRDAVARSVVRLQEAGRIPAGRVFVQDLVDDPARVA